MTNYKTKYVILLAIKLVAIHFHQKNSFSDHYYYNISVTVFSEEKASAGRTRAEN